jgi:hypothetical protein
MYTGRTEKPCCLCGDPETAHRIDIPPRTIRSSLVAVKDELTRFNVSA